MFLIEFIDRQPVNAIDNEESSQFPYHYIVMFLSAGTYYTCI